MTAATKTPRRWSMPDATMILPADAPRERWLAERRKGIGGSDASTIAGVNRWGGGLYELWLDKTGQLEERTATRRMEAGTRMEPVMRQWFMDETGLTIRRQGLVRSKADPILQVSLDGLVDDGGIFESKATNWRMADEWEDDQVADHAEIQAQHGMAVTGRTHAWVVALIDGWDFQIRRVERNQELIDLLIKMEVDFWERFVEPAVEPPVTAAALDVLKARYPDVEMPTVQVPPAEFRAMIADLEAAKAAKKTAEETVKFHEAQMRALIGGAEVALIGDIPVATLKTTNRSGYTVEPTSFRTLRIVKGKK